MIDVRRNVIRDNTVYAIVAQAGRPLATSPVSDSYLRVQLFDNECRNSAEDAGGIPILIQGGVSEAQEEAIDNEVLAQVFGNALPVIPGQASMVINDGLLGNAVHLAEPTQPHDRVGGVMPFSLPPPDPTPGET